MNDHQATKDRNDGQAIIASLKSALKQGDKKLIGNRGYRKYLRASGTRLSNDEHKGQDEARFDGKWVLTTNAELSAREPALKYRQLWQVEATFRTMKTALATRPIFHKRDDAIRGPVFCSSLALLLRDELQRRLAQRGYRLEWADILQDLERLQQIELTFNAKGYRPRADTEGCVAKVFQVCGVALPPQLEPL